MLQRGLHSMIKLQNVTFQRENRMILNQVNWNIQKGEQWAVLGRNGSGKTTILELLNGYQFPTSGTVDVFGKRFGQVDVREVRRKIGYMSQSLFEKMSLNDPVWQVVATGEYAFLKFYEDIPNDIIQKSRHILDRVRLPHVADQPLGTLSQGERKKVLLARALMPSPDLLIMDEPCSGLDLYEREKLLITIDELGRQGVSMIYVTHHLEEIVPTFTHVALLGNGQIIAAGRKEEVLTAELLRKSYDVNVEIDWYSGRPWIRVINE